MPENVEQQCASLFREVVGMAHTVPLARWDNARLLATPLDTLDVDSLTLLEFVMKVETAYDIELDEAAVNACRTIGELAGLVAAETQ